MKLITLSIKNFRNFSTATFEFPQKLFITGPNGSGKTTIAEAIYYFTGFRSFKEPMDSNLVKKGEEGFVLHSDSVRAGEKLNMGVSYSGNGKRIRINNEDIAKHSEGFGKFIAVVFSGEDKHLSAGSGKYRRKFTDRIISVSDRNYFNQLIDYHRILKQRNKMLKENPSSRMIDTYAAQMSKVSSYIYDRRVEFVWYFREVLTDVYRQIFERDIEIDVEYYSSKDNGKYTQRSLIEALRSMRDRERKLRYTPVGLHRDDYKIGIDGKSISRIGSDGEQRLLGIALKITEVLLIYESLGEHPLVILDDVLAELDSERKAKLMSVFDAFPQIIVMSPVSEDNVLNYPVKSLDNAYI